VLLDEEQPIKTTANHVAKAKSSTRLRGESNHRFIRAMSFSSAARIRLGDA
jgi:hypothetical protein